MEKLVPLSFCVQIEGKLKKVVVVLGDGVLLSSVIVLRKQVSVKPFRDPRTPLDVVFAGEHSGVIRFAVSSTVRELLSSRNER